MIYVILGQTASGKSSLAYRLAREFNLPLIGGDAFQIYKELCVGTDKPKKEDLIQIKYHLIDEISVKTPINVKEYQLKVRKLLDCYNFINQDVIFTGGTFLYIKAALYPYSFQEEEISSEIKGEIEKLSNDEAWDLLLKLDRESTLNISKENRRRVNRALEMAYSSKKKSERKQDMSKPLYPCKIYAIDIDREEGNNKINQRVDYMFDHGLIEEIEYLKKNFDTSTSPFQAIGYKEFFTDEDKSLEEIKEEIKVDTRRYAKRQRTFLRHQFPSIKFMKKEDIYLEISSLIHK